MARTAPVPNMVAIPGMNPGIFVLGGGGDGGGSGGGDGDGSGDKYGGKGKNGGKDAQGGGKGACATKGGKPGSGCPNHHRGASRTSGVAAQGDPVDVVTGHVFTTPVVDVSLGGPLPLTIERAYRSAAADRDVGLGFGWSHSLSWEIEVRRRTLRVHTDQGTTQVGDALKEGESSLGPDGWVLTRGAPGFVLNLGDGRVLVFAEKRENRYALSSIRDVSGNAIRLRYTDGLLTEVEDAAGRIVRVRRVRDGHIDAFLVRNARAQGQWIAMASFLYDDNRDLVRATDADGFSTTFAYEDHRLVRQTLPTGLSFHYRYDDLHRCVETWGAPERGLDPSLSDNVPALLADGQTPAKGIFHVKLTYGADFYCEAADSITVHRYEGNRHGKVDKAVKNGSVFSRTYDNQGHLASFTDPRQGTTKWRRDGLGRVVEAIDALGNATQLNRMPDGHITSVVDAMGGVTRVERVENGIRWTDPLGAPFEVRVNDHGLLRERVAPNGVVFAYRYDEEQNLVEERMSTGHVRRFSHDAFGRITSIVEADGTSHHYTYSDRGDLLSVRAPDGGLTRYTYDGLGARTSVTDPDGHTTTLLRGGLSALCEVQEPNGAVTRFRYDREGRLIETHSPTGEVHHFTLNASGLLVAERTFDGRALSYEYDDAGRLVAVESGDTRSEYEHDPMGRLKVQRYADGTEETFEYDALGHLIAAHGPAGDFFFERNALGWITRETQVVGGDALSVDTEYDLLGNPIHKATSLGTSQSWVRNPLGQTETLVVNEGLRVAVSRDAMGRETSASFTSGMLLESAYDGAGRLTARRVRARSRRRGGPGEPDWVGPSETPETEQIYRYSPRGDLIEVQDQEIGSRVLAYDPSGQILGAGPPSAEHQFAYDPSGNLYERGTTARERSYERGQRLTRLGAADWSWDDEGRVRQIVERTPGGLVSRHFEWTDRGLLRAVETSDGRRVEHSYDPFGRRVKKTVLRREPSGALSEIASTRFLWSSDVIAHEVRSIAAVEGDPIVEERSYVYEHGDHNPWAHVELRTEKGVRTRGETFFYVRDPLGAPRHLVTLAGTIAWSAPASAWGERSERDGARARTAFGFPGHYHDDETGLCYNRYRYYDPASGRYLSPDPVGLLGGINAFAYARNRPTKLTDPLGLMAFVLVQDRPDGAGNVEGFSNQARPPNHEPVRDPAITEAQDAADRHFGEGPGQFPRPSRSGNCAEIDALHRQADDIRTRLSGSTPGWDRMTPAEQNARVRNSLREEYRNGANISAFEGRGADGRGENPIPPCPYCAQVMRELGIHPANIDANPNPGHPQSPAAGGVFVGNEPWDGTTHYGGGAQAGYNSGSPERASTTNVVPALRPDGTQQTRSRAGTHEREGVFVPPEEGAAGNVRPANAPPPGHANQNDRGYDENGRWIGWNNDPRYP